MKNCRTAINQWDCCILNQSMIIPLTYHCDWRLQLMTDNCNDCWGRHKTTNADHATGLWWIPQCLMRDKENWEKTRHFISNDWESDDSYGRFGDMTVLLTNNCDYRRRMMPASDECRMHVTNAECNWRMRLWSVTTAHCQWQIPSATICSVADERQRQLKQHISFQIRNFFVYIAEHVKLLNFSDIFIMARHLGTCWVDDNTTYLSLWLMPETDGWQLQSLLSATHDYKCWPRHWSTTNY